MDFPVFMKISNIIFKKLSRSFTNDGFIIEDLVDSLNEPEAPITFLHDGTLLSIFQYLSISDLICISKVCKKWYQLSFDRLLWRKVDLRHFAKPLQNKPKLANVTHSYLANKVVDLDISSFTLPQDVLNSLSLHCRGLKKLVIKSVTFTAKKDNENAARDATVLFPVGLEYLDVRYSHGPSTVYHAMARQLQKLQWLGMCDALILAISNEQSLPFLNLEKLDMTHCKLVKDNFVEKLSLCYKLRLLSLRKCINICGEFLPALLQRLSCLETLILDGTSVQDEYLQLVDWKSTNIKYLELGWCPLVTTEGLQSFLPEIAKIPCLEYLGLCNVGQGQAITDCNLHQLALQLQQSTCPKLHSINLSFSHRITNEGVAMLERMCRIDTLDVTNCACVSSLDDDVVFDWHRNMSIEVFDSQCGTPDVARIRRSRGSFSTIQFALSNYTLETPL